MSEEAKDAIVPETTTALAEVENKEIALPTRLDKWKAYKLKESEALVREAKEISIPKALNQADGLTAAKNMHTRLVKYRTSTTKLAPVLKAEAQQIVQAVDSTKREILAYNGIEAEETRLALEIQDVQEAEARRLKAELDRRSKALTEVGCSKYSITDIERMDPAKFDEILAFETSEFQEQQEELRLRREHDDMNKARIQRVREVNGFSLFTEPLEEFWSLPVVLFEERIQAAIEVQNQQAALSAQIAANRETSKQRWEALQAAEAIKYLPSEYSQDPMGTLHKMPQEALDGLVRQAKEARELATRRQVVFDQRMKTVREHGYLVGQDVDVASLTEAEWEEALGVMEREQQAQMQQQRHYQRIATLASEGIQVPTEWQEVPALALVPADQFALYVEDQKRKIAQQQEAAQAALTVMAQGRIKQIHDIFASCDLRNHYFDQIRWQLNNTDFKTISQQDFDTLSQCCKNASEAFAKETASIKEDIPEWTEITMRLYAIKEHIDSFPALSRNVPSSYWETFKSSAGKLIEDLANTASNIK